MITDRNIYDEIGDINTEEDVDFHASEYKPALKQIFGVIAEDAEDGEDFLATIGEMFGPLREYLGGTDEDDILTEAFEASDRRKQH